MGSMSKKTQFIKGDQYFSKRGKAEKKKDSSSEDDKNESEEEPGQDIKAVEDDNQDPE
jgi:hypothetical protein